MTKTELLEAFARRLPNAQKILVDWNRDTLEVYFDGIHCNHYSIKEIIDAFTSRGGVLK